jgi:hypothetical protein
MEEDEEKLVFDEEDLVVGRRLVTEIADSQYKLGELADGIEPKYGKGTLESFADEIGIEYNTLKGYRTVWRAWKDVSVLPRNYSLAKALVSSTDESKEYYLEHWPNETEKQARADVRKWKKEQEEANGENKGYKLPNVRRLTKSIVDRIERWEYELDLLSRHRNTLTGMEIRDLVRALEKLALMVYAYRDKLREPAEIDSE